MNDADFDKYYRKGGEYVLPTEIFNDLLSGFRELQQENKQLKEQLTNNSKITIADHKYASSCEDKIIELEYKIKQRDEVIDEAIEFARDYDFAHNNVLNFYNGVLNRLQKYKGDNNE